MEQWATIRKKSGDWMWRAISAGNIHCWCRLSSDGLIVVRDVTPLSPRELGEIEFYDPVLSVQIATTGQESKGHHPLIVFSSFY